MEYSKELKFAVDLATEAGKLMVDGVSNNTTTWKADNTPVTETDLAINQLVIERVKVAYPDYGIVGEEDSHEDQREIVWVVDPIDGTMAFDINLPISTFCLSLVIDGLPVVSVVNNPFLNQLFTATKNAGSFLNNQKLQVSTSSDLKQNYIMLGNKLSGNAKTTGTVFDELDNIGAKTFGLRSYAYSSMFVARGKAIAAILGSGKPWDAAATKLIVEEAGGKVTDIDGSERRYDKHGKGLLATNGLVHDQLLKLIN